MQKTEKILVIKKGIIGNLNKDFQKTDKNFLKKLEEVGEYKTRYLMEEDLDYDQIIPYIAVIHQGKVLTYLRGVKGGESKLHGNYSIAVGGHVDEPDNIFDAAIREIEEEIGLKITKDDLKITGILNPNLTEVDKYHIGVTMILELSEELDLKQGELDILEERKFRTAEEMEEIYQNMENWSKVYYKNFIKEYLK